MYTHNCLFLDLLVYVCHSKRDVLIITAFILASPYLFVVSFFDSENPGSHYLVYIYICIYVHSLSTEND